MKIRDQGRRHIKHMKMAAQQHKNESKPVGKEAKEQPIAKRPVNLLDNFAQQPRRDGASTSLASKLTQKHRRVEPTSFKCQQVSTSA